MTQGISLPRQRSWPLVLKMPYAGCYHDNLGAVRFLDNIGVGNGTAGLDYSLNAGFFGELDRIGHGDKGIGGKEGILDGAASFFDRGHGAFDAAGLPAANPNGLFPSDE